MGRNASTSSSYPNVYILVLEEPRKTLEWGRTLTLPILYVLVQHHQYFKSQIAGKKM